MSTVQCNHCGRSFSASAGSATVMCPECGRRIDPMLAGTFVPMKPKGNGMAITSLVLGIVGILLCFCGLPSLLAVIFGAVALMKDTAAKGLAIAGLVLGLMGFLMAPIGLALFLPAVQASREAARRASCSVKLKTIGVEIAAYRQSHNGDFPPSLAALTIDPKLLQCPTDDHDGPETDYVYAPPQHPDAHDVMIACDSEVRHPGLRNVLFADGATKGVMEEDFQRALGEPQNSNLQNALSDVEGHGGPPRASPLGRPLR